MAAQDLTLEEGESFTLSPDSHRMKGVYTRENPRSAVEVRKILGLSAESAKAVHEAGGCCSGPHPPAASAAADDLESEDPETRAMARRVTYQAFNAFVYGSSPSRVAHLEPAFDRYLAVNQAVLNIAHLNDIEVFDGATLTISAATHAVYANKVIIHRTGRIVCIGAMTWRIASLEGRRRDLSQFVDSGALASATVAKIAKP